jgi:SAM-dependent methyltransferase
VNRVGESWRTYYQTGNLSWYQSEVFSVEYLLRLSRSEWITRMLGLTRICPNPGLRILEAGCGTGQHAIALSLLGFQVDAFDYNLEALEIARQLARKVMACGYEAPRFYQDDLTAPRSACDSYDLVFNQAVLEYFDIEVERRNALAQMARLTRPGGWVAIIVQHTRHPFRRLWEKLGWPGYINQPPVTLYTPHRLAQELCQAGLMNVRTDGIYPWKVLFWPPWHRRWKFLHDPVYLLGQALNRGVPLPCTLRSHLSIQILAGGRKLESLNAKAFNSLLPRSPDSLGGEGNGKAGSGDIRRRLGSDASGNPPPYA